MNAKWKGLISSASRALALKALGKRFGDALRCRCVPWLVYAVLLAGSCLPAYASLIVSNFATIQGPIAIDYDPYSPGGRFIVSHYQDNPQSFSQVSKSTGTVSSFAHIGNTGTEFYHTVLHQSWGPFGAGWVLSPAWWTSSSVLWAIDPAGNAYPVPTSGSVPNFPHPAGYTKLRYDPFRNVFYFMDESGGAVYKVSWDSTTSTAQFNLLWQSQDNSGHPEGTAVLGSNSRYGPWANHLVVLRNNDSTIYVIDPVTGNFTTYNLGINDLEVIYPADNLAELYITLYSQNKIIKVTGLSTVGVLPGDLLIAGESSGVYHVWWDGTQFQKNLLLQPGHVEDMIAIPEPGSLSVMAAGLLLFSARLSGSRKRLKRGRRS